MERESQWAKVLRLKYCTNQHLNSRNEVSLPCSRTWRSMKKGEAIFQKGITWVPWYESSLSFWHDRWSKVGIIRSIIQGPLTTISNGLKIKDVVSLDGWNWNLLQMEVPEEVRRKIQATPFPMCSKE